MLNSRELRTGRKLDAMKLSDGEKIILAMLCDIHEHLKIDNGTARLVRLRCTAVTCGASNGFSPA